MDTLQVENLHFRYHDKKILNGINFTVEQGEVFCVFGPNGCGKTTMLDCILGLNKPEEGNITIDGRNLTAMSPPQKAQKIAYVSQKSDRTFPYTVLEIVLMGRTAYTGMFSSPGPEDLAIAKNALDSVGMYNFRDRVYTKLSGGEAQLVKIARAIAQNAELIIFDEPTSHLDFRHELNVIRYIAKITKEKNISVIMATHFPNHAYFFESLGLPTRVALMENGAFEALGIPSEVLNQENMAKIFKIRTKNFRDSEGDKVLNFVVPIDFCAGGEWNEHEHKQETYK
ncbi:ABC transporter ATP-binding protein [Dehalobacter sp. DCM]|uniref:ABC transporter ATP-binding protein n=1 Tax=Dehalobacter sp. DCM TaxID=2907827 RepID=UPI003081845E|nr:ABC transporter ATP-binding protein [Dehalobacter sp. DCM]